MLWDVSGGPSKTHLYSLQLHRFGDFYNHFIVRKDGRMLNFSRLENKYQNMFMSISSTRSHIKMSMLCRWRYDQREWKSFLSFWSCIQVQEPNFLLAFCTFDAACREDTRQFEGSLWAAPLCHASADLTIHYATQQSHLFSPFLFTINCYYLVPLCL